MLFTIGAEEHAPERIGALLREHPEIRFVSLVGVDMGGHDSDEKIPVEFFLDDIEGFYRHGMQTDGSSVVLPGIAALNNARVDMLPDLDAEWFVDHNYDHIDEKSGLPVGTLRIPAFLLHNESREVGSRTVLRRSLEFFERELLALLKAHPYICGHLHEAIASPDEIAGLELTAATELEFWVKTPDDKADIDQLSTSMVLKEQYWKRTVGPVRTALEKSILLLNAYGYAVEMGHKETGGVKARLSHSGQFDHVMEQLELDWRYRGVMQTADRENQAKYVVKDTFRRHGLDVTFMAKPIEATAGNGEHTHIGVNARLKDGRLINLFTAARPERDFMNPLGYGALMGILKNYEVAEPFIASSIDALNRLKPGFEAPVCTVASLGHSVEVASRNRTVLLGLVRDSQAPLLTHFELRSPTPKNNTYLILSVILLSMLDGMRAVLEAEKEEDELLAALSKAYGEECFYLEKDRIYRSEEDIYEAYGEEERERFFGKAPATVWESLCQLDRFPEKLAVLRQGDIFDEATLDSYRRAMLEQWAMELRNRVVPDTMNSIRDCKKLHDEQECSDFDRIAWNKVQELRLALGRDKIEMPSLLHRIREQLDQKNYEAASALQLEMAALSERLLESYHTYKKNLL